MRYANSILSFAVILAGCSSPPPDAEDKPSANVTTSKPAAAKNKPSSSVDSSKSAAAIDGRRAPISLEPQEAADKANNLLLGHDFEDAIPLLDHAIGNWDGDQPSLEMAYWDRGIAYNSTGRHKRAVKDFTKAIEIGESGYLYHARGLAHFLNDDFTSALDDFKVAHDKIPGDVWTVMFLSQIFSCSPNDEDRDGKHAKQFANLIEAHIPEKNDLLSCAYAELGEFDKAIELQKEILSF